MLWARIKPGLIALLEELNFMESFNDFLTVLINMYCVSKHKMKQERLGIIVGISNEHEIVKSPLSLIQFDVCSNCFLQKCKSIKTLKADSYLKHLTL
ncbi:hypothetical protein T02_9454 [Trichinella nativa]|uniref:Uncharacterized protein n=1 Tax=Trichinella nativa TaxID=6335 RepID=A0A0V1KU31_9BILA|nr:hypothetical protein T02_9454 [Trichinella nativa]